MKKFLRTAVDVAIRDLQEMEDQWGTELALERLAECKAMLRIVFQFPDQKAPDFQTA